MNQKAFEMLGSPKAVELLFDKINGLIGMRSCPPELRHAYNVRKQNKSESYIIGGKAFCNFYNIKPTTTAVFLEPELEEGVLILNLRKVKEIPTRERTKSEQTEQTEQPNLPPQNGVPLGEPLKFTFPALGNRE